MRGLIGAAVLGIGLPMGVVFCNEGTLAQTLHEMKRHDEAILRNGISLSGTFREWSPLGDRTTIAGLARYQRFQLTFNQQIAVYERALESFDELPKRTPPTDSEAIDRGFIYDEDGAQHFIFDARIRALYQRGALNAYLKTVKALWLDSDGAFGIAEGEGHSLHIYPLDRPEMTLLDSLEVFLGSGRGYTFLIDNKGAECRERTDGLIEIRAKSRSAPSLPLPTGFYAGDIEGVHAAWVLTVDPKADYLVREAVFTANGTPYVHIKTSGQIKAGALCIAKRAECRIKPEVPYVEMKIEFTGCEERFSQSLYQKHRRALLNPPDKTKIFDYRFGEPPLVFTYRKPEKATDSR